MKIGIIGKKEIFVEKKDSAKIHASGDLNVFATPAMIALVEETAWKSIRDYLKEGESSVGTLVNIKHLSATPIGMKVTCKTELVEVEGKKLVFKAEVYDEKDLIAKGIHERFVVDADNFQKRTDKKQ